MDYEQKYKDALERMKSWAKGEHPECFSEAQKTAEFIFPELKEKESEDERIRKALIEMIHDTTGDECEDCYHVSKESVLSWLEKQGEKKNTRKREIDDAYLQGVCDAKHEIEKQSKKKSADEVLKIRQELYQSGYNDGYKHGQMDYAYSSNREIASSVKLDADNVLLQNYSSNVTCLVNQLKKDFGL